MASLRVRLALLPLLLMKRILAALLLVLAAHPLSSPAAEKETAPGFVGSAGCAACHAKEYAAWQGSQHRAAMQEATEKTVLGNFDGARFSYAGATSTFYKRDGKFFVKTDGPDGKPAGFPVPYTFGVHPLQQYLVELPGGRLQALSIAWDVDKKRWFHLYPNEHVTAEDELHWTRPAQNWNYMCADCHSTALRKNYDVAADRFATRWAEISVGCEACHGPGESSCGVGNRASRRQPRQRLRQRRTRRAVRRAAGVSWTARGEATASAPSRAAPSTKSRCAPAAMRGGGSLPTTTWRARHSLRLLSALAG